MAIKYSFQLRRGVKDDTIGRDDWANYNSPNGSHIPLDGELVLEHDNGVPRLKIGNGKDPFSALPYMSVDSFILPTPTSITLLPDKWQPVLDENKKPIESRYYQLVTVDNAVITPNSKVDLQASPEQLAIFHEKDITFTAINAGGNVRVCVVGQKPTQKYTIQVTITEVAEQMGEIIGNTTATPNPRSDWNQSDPAKADYILNKPELANVAMSGSYNDLVGAPCYEGENPIHTTIEIDMENNLLFDPKSKCITYLVSENVYTRQQLIGSVATWTGEYYDYNQSVVISDGHIAEETSDGMWIKVAEGYSRTAYIYIAYTTNYKPDGFQSAFPKRGVYFSFIYETDNPYTKRLEIDYAGSNPKTLNNKFLDLENNDVIKSLLARIEALEAKIK